MKRFFFASLLVSLNTILPAAIKLPALVGDNMVLQRDAKINLWGWADPGEKVSVEFKGKQQSIKAGKDGKWGLVLPSFSAGGPFTMIIRGKNTITIHNILIGDVWLASGQSNMEFMLRNVNNAKEEIDSANYPEIRLFAVQKKFAFQSQEDVASDGWQLCNPKTAENFSAVAYFFGRELYRRYSVPVGLIHSSWGGTTAETWTSASGLKQLPAFANTADSISKLTMSEYEAFKVRKTAWLKEFGAIDRGRGVDGSSWADINVNNTGWLKMQQPGLWFNRKELKGFCGTIWFRKEIYVPDTSAGKSVEINLGIILMKDSAFFNGQLIGTTSGYDKKRNYTVPGNLVKSGWNLVTLRITGVSEFGGMADEPAEMYMKAGEDNISLAGEWLYKTGPDLNTFPVVKGLSFFLKLCRKRPQCFTMLCFHRSFLIQSREQYGTRARVMQTIWRKQSNTTSCSLQ